MFLLRDRKKTSPLLRGAEGGGKYYERCTICGSEQKGYARRYWSSWDCVHGDDGADCAEFEKCTDHTQTLKCTSLFRSKTTIAHVN